MRFKYITLAPWPSKGWRLQWLIEDISPGHTIVVERSSGPEGPWEQVARHDWNVVVNEDRSVSNRPFFEGFYYRLKVQNATEDDVLVSNGVSLKNEASLVTNEIIRKHEMTLYGVNGKPGFHSKYFACYKRTMNGTKCYYCRNPHTEERLHDFCDVCKGSGYIEGWSKPILFCGRFLEPLQRLTSVDTVNESESETRQLRMAGYPMLEPGDILAEKGTGKRYRVQHITGSEPNGVLVSQTVMCDDLAMDLIENDLGYPGE